MYVVEFIYRTTLKDLNHLSLQDIIRLEVLNTKFNVIITETNGHKKSSATLVNKTVSQLTLVSMIVCPVIGCGLMFPTIELLENHLKTHSSGSITINNKVTILKDLNHLSLEDIQRLEVLELNFNVIITETERTKTSVNASKDNRVVNKKIITTKSDNKRKSSVKRTKKLSHKKSKNGLTPRNVLIDTICDTTGNDNEDQLSDNKTDGNQLTHELVSKEPNDKEITTDTTTRGYNTRNSRVKRLLNITHNNSKKSLEDLNDNNTDDEDYVSDNETNNESEEISDADNKRPFVCTHESCGKRFKRKEHLKNHVNSVHSTDRSYVCDYDECEQSFTSSIRLCAHRQRVHQIRKPRKRVTPIRGPYVCTHEECVQTFDFRPDFDRHLVSVHSTFNCDKGIATKKKLTDHKLDSHPPADGGQPCVFSYGECGKVYPYKLKRRGDEDYVSDNETNDESEEISDADNDRPFVCTHESCGKRFKRKEHLKDHVNSVHSTDRSYVCDYDECELSFTSSKRLSAHRKRVHQKGKPRKRGPIRGPYVCTHEECDQIFEYRSDLDRHLVSVHPTYKSYFCDYQNCGKRFATKARLTDHRLDTHPPADGGQPCVCPYGECGKVYPYKRKLYKHMKAAHRENKRRLSVARQHMTCLVPGCGLVCNSFSEVRAHKREAHPELVNRCPWPGCDYTEAYGLSIGRHIRSHSDERPHACEWPGCDYRAKLKGRLIEHQLVHSSDLVHACDWPGCGFSTRRKGDLTQHKVIHSAVRNHACDWPDCGKRFKFRTQLNSHLKREHTGKVFACDRNGCSFSTRDTNQLNEHKKGHEFNV
ncbi:unnamed protein product [Medioppia subpectinata]|uniref:C2H2-type domain-containing protein n=1 Tax=Medioppia subpectinata TaxID=1979941 RepID=A0A7R9KI24_9ACAR|nr:unnamed protein product [Medioppia subpectinata]CAG2102732.1 unnamed protein product [Medioppia subpectinata]